MIKEHWVSIAMRIKMVILELNDISYNECLHGYAIDRKNTVFARFLDSKKVSKSPLKFRRKGKAIDKCGFFNTNIGL